MDTPACCPLLQPESRTRALLHSRFYSNTHVLSLEIVPAVLPHPCPLQKEEEEREEEEEKGEEEERRRKRRGGGGGGGSNFPTS